MATKKSSAKADSQAIECRVLQACAWGTPDDIVSISPEDAHAGQEGGLLDPHPDAVAYAKSLTHNAAAGDLHAAA